jgi:hypothetical protein
VVHQLTALPQRFNPRDKAIYDATNRLRGESTRHLLDAARVNVQPGASNAKAKRELGWRPAWPSWRQGFREAPR